MELLDINGLYMWDNTIFDNMRLPPDVVKSDLIDMILYECRELTVTVVSPKIIKRAIELWSIKNIYYWTELQKTMVYNYNPIENYDRHEETSDLFDSKNVSNERGSNSTKTSGQNTTNTTYRNDRVTTDSLNVASYNSTTLEPRESRTVTEKPSDVSVTEMPITTTIETPDITTDSISDGVNKRTSYIHGNIGVMSTQQMIEAQRNIIDVSLYSVIVNSFKNEFCILKY